MKYNQHTQSNAVLYALKQSLTFALALICVVVLGGMMTVGVLKLQPFSVASNSMEPTLKVGTLVFVKEAEDYDVGDILSFVSKEHGGIVITHRCIDVVEMGGEKFYYCAGDNNTSGAVQQVAKSDVVGKVVYSSTLLGTMLTFVASNKIVILGFIILILLLNYIIYNKDIYNMGKMHT